MRGELAVLYRALRPLGLFPPVIRAMTLWECAVELGLDERDPDRDRPPTIVIPPSQQGERQGPLGVRLTGVDLG